MNALWTYFWPPFAIGLVIGLIVGVIAFHRRGRRLLLAAGLAATLALTALWHGPFGAAGTFAGRVERASRQVLVHYEMPQVTAHLHRGPLSRELILSGTADDFQRSELARLLQQLPGVKSATWERDSGGIPMIVEGALVSVAGFLFGLLLAYLVELHRRYNAQWNW